MPTEPETVDLAQRALDTIRQTPGLPSHAIATRLGVEKREVNGVLYGKLKEQIWQDRHYRWFPAEQKPRPAAAARTETRYAATPLARLCRYYLACLGHDESGVSVFAANRHGDLDYCELTELPRVEGPSPFEGENPQRLLGKLRKDSSRLVLYLGYPTTLKFVQSQRSNWSGFFVEPIFLFPVEIDQFFRSPRITDGYPIINQAVLKRFTNAEREAVKDELVQLEDELGLADGDELPDLDELVRRLSTVRPKWPWREACDPDALADHPALSECREAGIYNRAILVAGERAPYTQGLEAELKTLAQLPEHHYKGTALGQWLSSQVEPPEAADDKPLFEVLPLNTEQRQAVEQSLSRPITVITGPPGTGKSQVVTDLLINAAWRGKRVLFASKNNKAVDVVEMRVNGLGPRPVLLRSGSSQYQSKLAEYLVALLGATTSPEDKESFDEALRTHESVEGRLVELHRQEGQLVSLRNKVDKLEQEIEGLRGAISPQVFEALKTLDLPPIEESAALFNVALSRALKDKQPLLTRASWLLWKKGRYAALADEALAFEPLIVPLELRAPSRAPGDATIDLWRRFGEATTERLTVARSISAYLDALRALQSQKSLESIAKEQGEVLSALRDNAEQLWTWWLRLQPSTLASKDRHELNRYNALLKMVIDAGPAGQLSSDVFRQYRELFSRAAHLLPCWAVTSLSARGKIPFEPGYFDIVVFDEASQCDIASALPLLYRARGAVVIGDPKQLRHISGMQRGHDQQLLDKYDLVADHPQWAYSYNSLFDLAAGIAGSGDIVSLRDHHRSHADIIGFSNTFFYEDRLRLATSYERLNRPSLREPGVRWRDVRGQAARPGDGGAVNRREAEAVAEELRALVVERGYEGTVGVVSPFRAQANLIRDLVNRDNSLSRRLASGGFLVDTVHRFQGDERDLMVFSPVVADGISIGALGFLRNNGNLFNVAITRARAMLVVVGDMQACLQSGIEYLEAFARYVIKLGEAPARADETVATGPDYPAVLNPAQVSDWERVLYRGLWEAGMRPLPQFQAEKYALDFALIDGDRRLAIEVDGERYHRNWTGELCRRDQIRNHRLFELGWDVMRFWVYEVRDDLPGCIKRVRSWLEESRAKK